MSQFEKNSFPKLMQEKPVLFSEEGFGHGSVGVIQINRPQALNALNTDCYALLEPKLISWAHDPALAAILIESVGEKAFCAGGDVKNLVLTTREKGLSYAKDFFTREYYVDYLIHAYPKPVIVFADGITMGGGIGLMNGASHRIVTERTIMAMPEQGIGLFPDVAATYFLSRVPNQFGLFMGLTGARIGGDDAVVAGLADYFMPSSLMRKVRSDLLRMEWSGRAHEDRERLSRYFQQALGPQPKTTSQWQDYKAELEPIFHEKDYLKLSERFLSVAPASEFVRENQKRFLNGSPTSKRAFFEAYHRHQRLSLQEVFISEWEMAIRFSKETEFAEGVRAVLIDKDNSPRWNPSSEEEVKDLHRFFSSGEENLLALKFQQAVF